MAKRYKCPYCELRLIRKDLIKHIDKKHEELIPQGYTSAQLVYNQVNKIDHGKCRVCGKLTSWNEKSGRYNVLCDNPKCKEHMREEYKKNMLRVRGTYNILNDPEQQKKMLANRSISGSYKFSDGGILTYTGSYEKKCLEFMDVVMQIPSKDILSPGPTIEYEYNGNKHFYITDFYYIPYNLIIEVKDGGDNLNNKDSSSMRASREKTIEKERIITDRGEYNYIRLTNNDFSQLLDVFMTIKEKLLEGDVSKTYKINESVINDYFIEGNIISKIKNALKIDTNTKFNIHKASISDFNKFYNNNDFFIESLFDKESDLTDEKAQIIANNIASINISIKYKTVDIYLIKNSLLNNKYDLHKSNKFNDKSYSIVFPLNLFRSNEHHYVKELFHARYFNDVIDNREYREVKMGYHKMSPQVQWLADIDNNHKINESNNYIKNFTEDDMKYINESTRYNHYSKDVHTIIDNLSKEESNHIGNGYWVDSDHIIYRKVEYLNNKPVGFIDVYSLPKFKGYGLIIIAVSKDARGKGVGKKLVNSAIQNCKNNKDIDKLRWLADSDNTASINMAKSLGFKLNDDGQYKKEFIYDLKNNKFITEASTVSMITEKTGKYNRRRILLTSTGFTNKNIEKIFIDNIHKPLSDVKVIFVPTAANDPESKSIIPECYKDLTNAGISDKNIMWYDLDRQMNLSEIMAYDAIYFCGGSEKYLIKRINQINFKPILISAINNGIFFIGVSAGSMIVSDSVKNGLGIIKNKLEPHCEKNIALNGNINLNDNTQIRLSDNQALWIYGDRSIIVESCKDVETARKFLQDVDNLSKKYDANFFIVTDGASMTRNGRGKSEPAVKNARDSQIEWEKKNGGDPDEDWLKHTNESNNYIAESSDKSSLSKEFTPEDMKYIHDNDLIKKEYTDIEGKLSINESSDSIFDKILKLNDRLNDYEYMIPNNGNPITHIKSDDFVKYYILLSPNEFEKYKGGICWDYVAYEAMYFKAKYPNIKFETYYQVIDNRNDNPTHTFLIFEFNKKWYWFESSWKPNCGVYGFNNKDDCIEYIMQKLKIPGKNYGTYICKFDAADATMYGMNCVGYMNYMSFMIKPYKFTNKKIEPVFIYKGHCPDDKEYVTESEDKSELTKGFKSKISNIQYKTLSIDKPEIYDYLKNHFSKNNPMWEGVKDSKTYMDCFINGNNSRHIKRVGEVLINKSNDEVIGYEVVEKPDNFLAIEIPNKKYRGYGFGNMLLEDAIKKHGCRKLYVAVDNKISLKMYKNKGFEIIKKCYDDEYYLMELKESSINELCTINISNTFIQTYIRLFVDYIQKKYKSNVDTIDIKIVHSKQAIEMKKKKLKYINYSNDFIVINYNQITIVDEDVYGDQPINYNSFLKFHITKVLLSTYACDDNTRLINAICTYESGIYNEIGEKTSELKDAAIYAEYLNKYGPNMVVNNLIKRSHTQYPIF